MNRSRVRALAFWVLILSFLLAPVFFWSAESLLQNPWLLVPITAETVAGALIARRRPDNPMGWVFLGIGALTGWLVAAVALTAMAAESPDPVPWWGVLGAWVATWVWYPVFYLLTTATLLLYPSGLLSPRWRLLLAISLASLAGIVVAFALSPTLVLTMTATGEATRTITNPVSPGFMTGIDKVESLPFVPVLGVVSLLCGFAAVASSILRVRRARGVERQQMRWFGFAVAVMAGEVLLEIVASQYAGSVWLNLTEAVALAFVPVACGIAILRYRLYEIDRIISRTASYVLVTGALLGVYALVVTTVGQLLPESNALAVASATLAAAALFRPLLSSVQRVVDHRFNRARYDAERTVDAFASRLREEVDPDVVTADLLQVVERTVVPEHASLWLRAR